MKEQSDLVKALGFKGFAKYIGKEWKKIGPQERKPFKDMAARDKARYGLELIAWQNEQAEFLDRLQESEDNLHQEVDEQTYQPPNEARYQEPQQNQYLDQNFSNTSSNSVHDVPQIGSNFVFEETVQPAMSFDPSNVIADVLRANAYPPNYPLVHQPPSMAFAENGAHFFFFDEEKSLANMARDFGNDGIDYLLRVLGPSSF